MIEKKTRRVGRPFLPNHERRCHWVRVRLTEIELKELDKLRGEKPRGMRIREIWWEAELREIREKRLEWQRFRRERGTTLAAYREMGKERKKRLSKDKRAETKRLTKTKDDRFLALRKAKKDRVKAEKKAKRDRVKAKDDRIKAETKAWMESLKVKK